MDWTPERIKLLCSMRNTHSVEQIAATLGVTVNAVRGKLFRIKVTTGFRQWGGSVQSVKKVKVKPSVVAEEEVPVTPLPLLKLGEGQCRWPVENGLFCARSKERGRPYCGKHTVEASR